MKKKSDFFFAATATSGCIRVHPARSHTVERALWFAVCLVHNRAAESTRKFGFRSHARDLEKKKTFFSHRIGPKSRSTRSRASRPAQHAPTSTTWPATGLGKIFTFFSDRTESEIDSEQGNPAGATRADIDYLNFSKSGAVRSGPEGAPRRVDLGTVSRASSRTSVRSEAKNHLKIFFPKFF